MKMEIPFWSSLYAPKATISPSLVFAAYFSKSRSLMNSLVQSVCQKFFVLERSAAVARSISIGIFRPVTVSVIKYYSTIPSLLIMLYRIAMGKSRLAAQEASRQSARLALWQSNLGVRRITTSSFRDGRHHFGYACNPAIIPRCSNFFRFSILQWPANFDHTNIPTRLLQNHFTDRLWACNHAFIPQTHQAALAVFGS